MTNTWRTNGSQAFQITLNGRPLLEQVMIDMNSLQKCIKRDKL